MGISKLYITINASYEGICFEFEWKNNNYFQIAQNTKSLHPLDIIFDDFGIWLLGYRIEISCLYIPHGHYLWL